MRATFITSLTLVILLALVTIVSSEANPGRISIVEIHVDGFICATCVRDIERALKVEEGVARVTGDWEKGIVAVLPDQEIGWVDLFDLSQRINSTRNYSVLKMNVVAIGTVIKYPVEYYVGGLYAYSGDRYKLQVGDGRKSHFILARNDKLDELVKSGHKAVRLTGIVRASSSRQKVPVMEITKFDKLGDEEEAEVVASYELSEEVTPDQILSVEMYVDGFICSTCIRILESNLMTEEGVGSVEADLETGIVKVTPVFGAETLDPFYLRRRINSLRDYSVSRMDVEVVGTVTKFPVRFFNVREYTHSHDRYKIQVDDKFFILAEDEELHKFIESGLKRVRLKGTIKATSEGRSIITIGAFQPVDAKTELVKYDDPMDAFVTVEKKLLEKAGSAHIESIRVYVDGFVCAACERPIRNALAGEEGVKIASTDADVGLIELVPKEGATLDLLDVEQRINAMRGYKVLKIDIVASGKIEEIEMGHQEDSLYPETHNRHVLAAGQSGSLLLSENDVLAKMLESGSKAFSVVGKVVAFWGNVPILSIRDYKEFEEYPEWLK